MVGHVKKTEDVTAAGDAYATAVKAYMWDSRATVFAATRGSAPRTSDKLDELLAHASLFRDLPDAPDGSSSTGIEFDVFGWGDLVDSVVVVRTKKPDKGEARGVRIANSGHSQQWSHEHRNAMKGINAFNLEAGNKHCMRVLAMKPVNGLYAEQRPETVALHCGLATLQEKFVEPADEVTGQ